MITVFNRAEIATTIDLEQQRKIREILSKNNIEYLVKTRNNVTGHYGTHQASWGTKPEVSISHTFFVHKKDYDVAVGLLGRL